MRKLYLHILLLCLPWALGAQVEELSNLRRVRLPVTDSLQTLDSLPVLPRTLHAFHPQTGKPLPDSLFRWEGSGLRFSPALKGWGLDSVELVFRILRLPLEKPLFRLDSALAFEEGPERPLGIDYDLFSEEGQGFLPEVRGLNYSGNFTRGLSFGNSQNLVLNSSFNLQMAGDLGDGLEVLAAISDQNIPIQPEGNTQQLNEFDRVFVQISKERHRLIAGDYELQRPRSYFLNYFKKLQGATYEQTSPLKNGGLLGTRASVAVARGKFARNQLQVQEGNQGPYRLEGAEGERFIIVLSGTEKVWLDGELLTRGLEADYAIDYNAGQITFTRRRPITKDSRVIVEFEYSDQNYLRSLLAFNAEWQPAQGLDLYLNLYSEQDGKKPLDRSFSEGEAEALALAGDDPLGTLVSGVDSLGEFSPFRVQYELRDTVVDGVPYSGVLVFSNDPDRARYTAVFSFLGPGLGNYVLDTEAAANGRVYRWVAPDPLTGQPQGQYEPVRRLVAPRQQQLASFGGEWKPDERTHLRSELALSNLDRNRLSSLNDDDNLGFAWSFGAGRDFQLGNGERRWQLRTDAAYEWVNRRFRPLNPYRPPEFSRDWNLTSADNRTEHLGRAGFRLLSPRTGSFEYAFNGFFRDSTYTGTKHEAAYRFERKGLEAFFGGNLLQTETPEERTAFFRPTLRLAIPLLRDSTGSHWTAGFHAFREKNERFARRAGETTDTLAANSFFFDQYRLFFQSPEQGRFRLKGHWLQRIDHLPEGAAFERASTSDETALEGSWQAGKSYRLGGSLTHRRLRIHRSDLSNQEPTETILGRLDQNLQLARGALRWTSSYEIGSGQERKVEFSYLQVPAGEGTHLWEDDNGDGKVQLDEVEVAPFQDLANAVRITTFTDEFIRVNNVQFNQSLLLEPKAIWFDAAGWRRFLARFANQSSLQVGRKVRQAEGVRPWNPFQLDIADTALVAARTSFRNTLYFNRADPRFEVQANLSENAEKLVLTTGFESRVFREYSLRPRINWSSSFSSTLEAALGRREQSSRQFPSRNYRIHFLRLAPELNWLPTPRFRSTLQYRFERGENRLNPSENATQHELRLESVLAQGGASTLSSSLSWVRIRFSGDPASPVGFAFLNGLRNGGNFIWNLAYNRQVGSNLQIGFSYEGRKSAGSRFVHVGRAQVGATF